MSAAQDEYNELFRDKARRSAHPEDDIDEPTLSGDDSDDLPTSTSAVPANDGSRSRTFLPSLRSNANTGPKGVIADAQAFEDAKRNKRTSLPAGGRTSFQYPSQSASDANGPKLEELQEDSEDGEVDDEFMNRWRQSRLQELHGAGKTVGSSGKEQPSRGTLYGGLLSVDGLGYLEAVDGSPSGTVVVVFIYDDRSEVSTLVENCIRSLARKHTTTRFVKLHYLEAEMEPAGVPAVLAYQAGEKFVGFVPIVDEIPDDADLSPSSLEALFSRHQIL